MILAAHLLRAGGPALSVTLIEKRGQIGRGIAYSTAEPSHLLNVRAANMSALADDPGHFARWLDARGIFRDARTFYAPRMLYGEYLADLIPESEEPRLRRLTATCVGLLSKGDDVEALLADGATVHADAGVLATGHEENPLDDRAYAVRFGVGDAAPLDAAAPVLILGTGLSMVDAWLTLERQGHQGPVTALSRRGLLPNGHAQVAPVAFARSDLPIGRPVSAFLHWLRNAAEANAAAGGDWRFVVDGLRPFNQAIWQAWDGREQRRFLRHAKTAWHIHRHRMAPEIFARIGEARATGRLRVLAGRLRGVEADGGGWKATIRLKGAGANEALSAARIIDCCGVATDPAKGSNPLIRALLDAGAARPDPMRIGLDVTDECALVDHMGAASDRLFAVGPLTRGTFLEIEAVPDIRLQCAALARRLVDGST